MTTTFNARPPGRDSSLGQEFIPGLHREPTDADTRMWSGGAKAALRYAADLARKALADGQSPKEVLLRLDNSTALPLNHLRYGHEFETAAIFERSATAPVWLAWTIGPREVTVHFEGGYPRYTSMPKDGQTLWDFVFDCAVGLGSERLTALMGNEQVRFEVDGARLTEWGLASQYGGKTVTVVMIYDPTKEEE